MIESIKNNLFNLNTSRLNAVSEILLDKLNINKENITIRSSIVLYKNTDSINEDNIIQQIINSNISNRIIYRQSALTAKYIINIQQLKLDKFENIYLVLYFKDYISIYKIAKSFIITSTSFTNKQHSDNTNECQFKINKNNFEEINNKFLICSINYDTFLRIVDK